MIQDEGGFIKTKLRQRIDRRKYAMMSGVLLLSVLAATGCGVNTSGQVEQQPLAVTPVPQQTELPQQVPAYTYALTGLPAKEENKQRPIMVMIENSPAARPQTGLDQADIVYEVLAEGEITRFAAIYQSKSPAMIGPVRSIRPYYVQIGDGHHAIIVHAGWSQAAMNLMEEQKVNHLDQVYGDHNYYWRDNSRKAPHNVYTSIELILKGAANKHFAEQWKGVPLRFADQEQVVTGQAANEVKIPYIRGYEVSYTYDSSSGQYVRAMEGKPHLDGQSGEPLTARNIIISESKHQVLDREGRRDVDVIGPGQGYLITKGKARAVQWERKEGIIRLYDEGKEVALTPGQTWIQFVPNISTVTIQ